MAKREDILRLAKEHGALNVRLFGSAVLGGERPDSDVDFLIGVAEKTSPWFPAGFMLDLEKLLGRKLDVVTEDGLHWSIRDEVIEEAVPV